MTEWLDRYAPSAELFVQEVLRATPEPWQLDVLREYDAGRFKDGKELEQYSVRISIASGHGVGKTALLGWLSIHHAATLFPQKTAVTAPSSPQLFDALWPEIATWISKMPPHLADKDKGLFYVKSERIELRKEPAASFISAKTSRQDQPEALQGVHSPHVLLIADEGSGIPDAVIEAAGGSMSGHRVVFVMAGNPIRGQGYFYDTHHRLKGRWLTHTVSVFDSKWASASYAEEVEARYGKDSNWYRTKVLGLFPLADDDAVIPFDLAASAVGRDVKRIATANTVWGLDVAYLNHRTALAKRRANELLEPPKAWGSGLDPAQVTGYVKQEWDSTPDDLKPSEINIDVIGYGYDVYTRLRALGLPARAINVSESPSLKSSSYRNLKSELWFKTRHWFAKMDAVFPAYDKDKRVEDLIEELTTTTYKPQPVSGKILVEQKKTAKRSPDLADAFVLTMASESMTISGQGLNSDWGKPLSEPLKGIV